MKNEYEYLCKEAAPFNVSADFMRLAMLQQFHERHENSPHIKRLSRIVCAYQCASTSAVKYNAEEIFDFDFEVYVFCMIKSFEVTTNGRVWFFMPKQNGLPNT